MSVPEDVSAKIAFIRLVESHPCLWNFTLPSHSRTDLTTLAWKDIAKKIGDTVYNCRERWKNIRTAHGRSLKHSKSGTGKYKKPYYLAHHMTFLKPFMKTNNSRSFGNLSQLTEEDDDSTEGNIVPQGASESQESVDGGEMDNDFDRMEESLRSDDIEFEIIQDSPMSKKAKIITPKNEADDEFVEWVNSHERREVSTNVDQQDSDLLFFQSMLPDFKKLDNRRKRTLKAKFLLLLNEQLDEFEKDTSNSVLTTWECSPSAY